MQKQFTYTCSYKKEYWSRFFSFGLFAKLDWNLSNNDVGLEVLLWLPHGKSVTNFY